MKNQRLASDDKQIVLTEQFINKINEFFIHS